MGSQRVEHDWATEQQETFTPIRETSTWPESLSPCTGKSGMTNSLEVLAKEEDKNLNLYHNHPCLLGDYNFP